MQSISSYINPVSYTHLDVYKRQVIGRENHENREWLLTTKYVMQ